MISTMLHGLRPKIVVFAQSLLVVGSMSVLVGCAEPEGLTIVEEPVSVLYERGLISLRDGRLGEAAERFQEIELQHPYSEWAARAQLMAGYALYKKTDYNAAILVFDRYVEFNPDSNRRDYAEYMAAISYFDQIVDVGRDQFLTEQAAERFLRLIEQFPNSTYARDVRLKYELTQDQLAAKHMDIGRFYQKRLLHSGAINRFSRVIKDYNTTTHVPEALFRLAESQLAIGLRDDAQMAGAVLGYNYPESRWYQKTYDLLVNNQLVPVAQQQGWLFELYDSVNIFDDS